jgi:hypothetical protein
VKITAALHCDHATIRDGLLHILGGGITQLGRPAVPAKMDTMLALMLGFADKADFLEQHSLDVTILYQPTATRIVQATALIAINQEPLESEILPAAPVVLDFRDVTVPDFGVYSITISADDSTAELTFEVVKTPIGETASATAPAETENPVTQ